MDYTELALELMSHNMRMHRTKPQRRMDRAMRGEDFVLKFIYDSEGDVVPSEIRDEMDISSARIAAALNSLESKSLISRRIDPNDRRRVLVRLTPEGETWVVQNHRSVIDELAEMLNRLGENDAREYVRIIGKLADQANDK